MTIAFFMTACSSTTAAKFPDFTKMITSQPEKLQTVDKVAAPEWTAIKSGVYHDALGNAVFYGQGLVSKNEVSQDKKTLSEDRARDDLAIIFTSYVERLVGTILTSHSDNSLDDVNTEQLRNSIDEGTVTILMEAKIINHWLDPDNGKVYSMAEFELKRLIEKLDSFESISIEDRSFLSDSIVQAHASMTNGTLGQVAMAEKRFDVQPKVDRLLSY